MYPSSSPQFHHAAVHTPQPITAQNNGFSAINTDWQARGRENWASFSTAPIAPPAAINSVPVQIENQTNNSDLISL